MRNGILEGEYSTDDPSHLAVRDPGKVSLIGWLQPKLCPVRFQGDERMRMRVMSTVVLHQPN